MVFGRLVDWKWSSQYGPGILSWFHIMWLVIAAAGCVGLVILAKKKNSEKIIDWTILGMDIILIISEIPKHILNGESQTTILVSYKSVNKVVRSYLQELKTNRLLRKGDKNTIVFYLIQGFNARITCDYQMCMVK